jgi:hypothetical protein
VRQGAAERMGRALTRRAVEILDADATQRFVILFHFVLIILYIIYLRGEGRERE